MSMFRAPPNTSVVSSLAGVRVLPVNPAQRSLLFVKYMHISSKGSRPCGESIAMSLTNWTRFAKSSMRCPPS
jgi:hypothetical protein